MLRIEFQKIYECPIEVAVKFERGIERSVAAIQNTGLIVQRTFLRYVYDNQQKCAASQQSGKRGERLSDPIFETLGILLFAFGVLIGLSALVFFFEGRRKISFALPAAANKRI